MGNTRRRDDKAERERRRRDERRKVGKFKRFAIDALGLHSGVKKEDLQVRWS